MRVPKKLMMMMGGPGFVTLPKNLTYQEPILENFNVTGDWAVNNGSAAANTTAGEFREGTQSIKVTASVGADGRITKTSTYNFGAAPNPLRVSFFVHDPVADYVQIIVYVGLAGYAKYFHSGTSSGFVPIYFHPGWVTIDIYPEQWTNVNANSWATAQNLISLRFTAAGGKTPSISFDKISQPTIAPAVIMAFDDEYSSQYTVAYPYMKARRARGVIYTVSDHIGAGGTFHGDTYMTAAQLVECDADGWDIANHSKTHTNLTTLDLAGATAELADCKSALDALGLTKASMYAAWPGGGYNDLVVRLAAIAAGMRYGRGVFVPIATDPTGDQAYQMHVIANIGAGVVTLAQAEAFIDLIATGRIGQIYGHHIITPTIDTLDWSIADFQA